MKYAYACFCALVFVVCTSCNEHSRQHPPKATEDANAGNRLPSIIPGDPMVHTAYAYSDSSGRRLVIKNSLPKGGQWYEDSDGHKYVYAVFWTRMVNETLEPLEVDIGVPPDSFPFPASSSVYVKMLLPPDTVTKAKASLFDFGLDVKSLLATHRYQSSSLKRTIEPGDSSAFYIVLLSNKGVHGVLRPGLALRGQELFYTIRSYTATPERPPTLTLANEQELYFGRINLKKLKLHK